jgi:hypothetical protein
MIKKAFLMLVGTALGVIGLTGCATIVGHPDATFIVTSVPPGANVSIINNEGQHVYAGTTPTTVTLPKSNGHYFGGQDYTFTFSLAKYCTNNLMMEHHINGWYFGNILLGGVIGMVLVDPWNGGMYSYSTSNVNNLLKPVSSTDCLAPKGKNILR